MKYLLGKHIRGKNILEVGARNVNGSLREYCEYYEPHYYVGVDLVSGKGVDHLCSVENIVDVFGEKSFDLVLCTEVLEHIKDWKLAIKNIKKICSVGGNILLTTKSIGFARHDYPSDYWRFEIEDMKHIFSDCRDVVIEPDPIAYGVFVKATRNKKIIDLQNYEVYSMAES
jgi:SAM-dependent methyltransferase